MRTTKFLPITNKLLKMIKVYYYSAIIFGIINFYMFLTNSFTLKRAYDMGGLLSIKSYAILVIGLLLFTSSIILFIIIYKEKLPKIMLAYPIYNIAFNLIWLNAIPFLLFIYYQNTITTVSTLSYITKFTFIFYFGDLLIPAYTIYTITTYKRGGKNEFQKKR